MVFNHNLQLFDLRENPNKEIDETIEFSVSKSF